MNEYKRKMKQIKKLKKERKLLNKLTLLTKQQYDCIYNQYTNEIIKIGGYHCVYWRKIKRYSLFH